MTGVNDRRGLVAKAHRAFASGADTRALKRELEAGNPYALRKLESLGLAYDRAWSDDGRLIGSGAIYRRHDA